MHGYANSRAIAVLKTGVTPSASGSAYLELEAGDGDSVKLSGLKVTCTVHGPRPLPKSAPFSPYVVLSAHVKHAPFASRQRRGYVRDATERDLSVHLETALRGAIIADRWPKSGVDVIITVIEGDQPRDPTSTKLHDEWDLMSTLSGCITVASAALADAGIDCVDTIGGGIAALVDDGDGSKPYVVMDPVPSDHKYIHAACCVAYLPNRDEITNTWFKGKFSSPGISLYSQLTKQSIRAATAASRVISRCLEETLEHQDQESR